MTEPNDGLFPDEQMDQEWTASMRRAEQYVMRVARTMDGKSLLDFRDELHKSERLQQSTDVDPEMVTIAMFRLLARGELIGTPNRLLSIPAASKMT